jgi:cyclopropane fatty-acyl-phospholipid synthase-like methyltransferase
MFKALEGINSRPKPFEFYTASDLWTDRYTSEQMLSYHLNADVDLSSRNSDFIDRSVDWIVSNFAVGSGTKIADFGCGPGLYATRLAQEGADVTGIDFSKRSIQYAQEVAAKEGLDIHYVNQNYLEFETDERFDLVLMIMCDFCALSPKQRQTMLDKFHTVLKPHGAVLLDVYTLAAFDSKEEGATYERNALYGFWSPDDYYGFLNTFKYADDKVVLDKHTIVEESRVRTVYNWLQHFSPEKLKGEFAKSGFTAEKLCSDVAGSEFDPEGMELAIVAKKT